MAWRGVRWGSGAVGVLIVDFGPVFGVGFGRAKAEEVEVEVKGLSGEAVGGERGGLVTSVLIGVPASMEVRRSGVLKGETKGLERVADAVSKRRRLAAGVEVILFFIV